VLLTHYIQLGTVEWNYSVVRKYMIGTNILCIPTDIQIRHIILYILGSFFEFSSLVFENIFNLLHRSLKICVHSYIVDLQPDNLLTKSLGHRFGTPFKIISQTLYKNKLLSLSYIECNIIGISSHFFTIS